MKAKPKLFQLELFEPHKQTIAGDDDFPSSMWEWKITAEQRCLIKMTTLASAMLTASVEHLKMAQENHKRRAQNET